MKKWFISAVLMLIFSEIGFAQVLTGGAWKVTPYPEQIIRLTWEHPKQQRAEQISNAVAATATGNTAPLSGNKNIMKLPGWDVKSSSTGAELIHGSQKIKLPAAFDSGHIRGMQWEMPANAAWLGGGERATPMIRNGQRISLYNAPAYGYGENQDQLNYAVPFLITTAGYGLFLDNPSKGYIDIGKKKQSVLEAAFESGSLDVYIIPGDTPAEIIRKYTKLTGTQPLPPRWALGNLVSRFGYFDRKQTEIVVAKMLQEGFPVDAVIIDLFWFGDSIQHTLGNLEWNTPKWPNPQEMIEGFAKKNIQTILITEPFFIEGTRQYDASKPFLATDSTGKPYRLEQFYFGKGGLLDVFRKPAQEWFWQFYQKQNKIGVTGWWGDLGEPEHHPHDVLHDMRDFGVKRKMHANEVHNLYGHIWSQMVYENWKKDYPGKRHFFLNRAGFAGSQRFSIFPWTGDVGRNWSGLRAQLPTLQSMSLSGVPYIHSDAGGYAATDKADSEMYIRWLQFAAYTPVFRPHGSALEQLTPQGTISLPSEPVFWDDLTKKRALKLIQERYRLLPYNYTLAWEQHQNGKPLMRPMMYDNITDSNLLQATDQFMWGNALLVAPVIHPGINSRKIYLPAGKWYRLHDNSIADGGQWIEEQVSMDRIPVFVKGGSFIPYWEKKTIQSTAQYSWTDTVALRYYPGFLAQPSYLYDDDGEDDAAAEKINGHQLISFSGNFQQGTLYVKGIYQNWPPKMQRVIKVQIPAAALNKMMQAGNEDKLRISINGIPYRGGTIAFDAEKDAWINIYVIANGMDFEIRIQKN